VLNAMITAKALNILLPDVHAEKVQNRVINVERQTDADSPPEIPDQTLSEDMEVEVCGDSIQTAPFDDDLAAAIECYDKLILGKVSADEVSLHTSLDVLKDKVEKEKTVMMEYCTARLRLQFMDMIDTLRQFIKAERTGDWQLHIKSVQDMLPYFAAAGHNLYAKSCHIYLQQMMELPQLPTRASRCLCSSRRCSCKKHGLDCSSACGECRGVGCSNSPVISQEFNSEDCDY